MARLFSPSTKGFYDSESTTLPGDAVTISESEYVRALEAQSAGKLIAGVTAEGVMQLSAPPEPEQTVPESVTPAQGLMALYELKGITEDDILAAIDSITDPALRYQALIAYKKATKWERSSVSMQTLAGLLALTEGDLDQLFTLAVTYTNL